MIIKDPKAASEEEEGGAKRTGQDEKDKAKKKKKKKIGEDGQELDEEETDEEEEEEEDEMAKAGFFKLPDEKKLEESRQLRLKEKKMKAIIREIVIHLLFVMLCLFIGYSNMNPFAVGYGTSVRSFTGGELAKVCRFTFCFLYVLELGMPVMGLQAVYISGSQTIQIILNGDPLQHTFSNRGPPWRDKYVVIYFH